ncbi:hypothetical protein [Fluviispira sanaruensis]|uniref:MFS transporter n=1 Tax=Fluviispira sanaruensis TaxID=2493639 RepID=A0A4P2VL74_FLUSA|nr:hypothetical protein [Fluviispira sanaruensis]BBH52490.1 hypothetical protein JCM31447_09310 [Fluviispira sanaruensis]
MTKKNYESVIVLMAAEALERFAYFFISFIFIIYMMTPLASGGLGFTQELSYKVAGIFSLSLLFLPLLFAPFIDRKIGMEKATYFGAIVLFLGYFFAFIAFYLNANFIYLSFFLCAIGTSVVKPTMSALVSKMLPENNFILDILYIIFIIIVNISSITSAYFASILISKYAMPLYFNFLVSAILIILYFILIRILHKNMQKEQTEIEPSFIGNKKIIFLGCFLLCFLIGIAVSLSAKIFPAPLSKVYWGGATLGLVFLTYFLYKIRIEKNKYFYNYFIPLTILFFCAINVFFKEIGTISPIIPGMYSSFDLFFNFVAFPMALAFVAKSSNVKYLVTAQAALLFLFAYGSILMKNYLKHPIFVGDFKLFFLAILIFIITLILFRICKKYVIELKEKN